MLHLDTSLPVCQQMCYTLPLGLLCISRWTSNAQKQEQLGDCRRLPKQQRELVCHK